MSEQEEWQINPYRYDICEWSAEYDQPHHLYPGNGTGYEDRLPGDDIEMSSRTPKISDGA